MTSAARPRIVDLSVAVDPANWEPDPVRRTVVDHRAGADLLGRAYAHLTARNRVDRWIKVLRHRLGSGVTHRDFPGGQGLSLMRYALTTHTGTHLDAPYHYGDPTACGPARTICQVPLDWCHGDGVLLDLTAGPADEAVTRGEIEQRLAAIDHRIQPFEIVLLWTGGDTEIGQPGYFQRFRGVTAEATAYGGILALRALVVIGCFALHSAAVDPDDLLRAFRRLSFRSALTAALATRMVPVLARDARRLRDAQRALAGPPAPRHAVVRAVAAGALDRAVDVAATLEVRGYGAARRPPRGRRPWSRHDLAFAVSAAGLAALAVTAWLADWEAFAAYPHFTAPVDGALLGLLAGLALVALVPYADRRGMGA